MYFYHGLPRAALVPRLPWAGLSQAVGLRLLPGVRLEIGGVTTPFSPRSGFAGRTRPFRMWRVLPSLPGLVPLSPGNPALKRWAMVFRPEGLSNGNAGLVPGERGK